MPGNLLKIKNADLRPFEIKSKTATTAEIIIYGAVGASWFEDSISAKQFSDELQKLAPTVNEITVRINSPGGDVFDGIAIYNRLKQHSAKIIVYIDGLAASIASIIALAGDEVIIGEGALYMIHLPWTGRYANRIGFETVIDRLIEVEEQMIGIYARKSKKTRAEIKDMLETETWMNSDQALEMGFVDKKSDEGALPIAAAIFDKATWITKPPKMTAQAAAVSEKVNGLKNKIEEFLARPKV